MDFTDYMLIKAGVILVIVFCWQFYKGLTGK